MEVDQDEDEEDDSPLLLETLLGSEHVQHQIVGVSLLQTLLECPQVRVEADLSHHLRLFFFHTSHFIFFLHLSHHLRLLYLF